MTHTGKFALALGITALALLASSDTAVADAIMPPPDDCVAGAIGRSSHGGMWCTPTTCNDDSECAAMGVRQALFGEGDHNYLCREVDLCVRSETYPLGGGRRADDESSNTGTREIASSCTPSCEAPGTCTHVKRCVRRELVEPPAPPVAPPTVAHPPSTRPTAPPPAAATGPSSSTTASSGGMCAISARGAAGPLLVLLGAFALVALRSSRRAARRPPPR